MIKLYPGISPIAASRMERIAGSYAALNEQQQLDFTTQLREQRKRGAKAKAVTNRKVEDNGETQEIPVTDRQEAERDAGSIKSPHSESSEHAESEDAGG